MRGKNDSSCLLHFSELLSSHLEEKKNYFFFLQFFFLIVLKSGEGSCCHFCLALPSSQFPFFFPFCSSFCSPMHRSSERNQPYGSTGEIDVSKCIWWRVRTRTLSVPALLAHTWTVNRSTQRNQIYTYTSEIHVFKCICHSFIGEVMNEWVLMTTC